MLGLILGHVLLVFGLAFAVATGDFDSPKITQLELMRTPFYMVLVEGSALAKHREIELGELDARAWALFERHIHPPLYDTILRLANEGNVHPRSVHHVVNAEEAAQELYAGSAEVAFLTRAGAWKIARNGPTMRPLHHPTLFVSSKLIARAGDTSRVVSEFARAFKGRLETTTRIQLNPPLNSHSITAPNRIQNS